LAVFTAATLATAEEYYWNGGHFKVSKPQAWDNGTPDLYNGAAQNDVWVFDTTGGYDPNIDKPNIRLGGMIFTGTEQSRTISGSNPLNFYGFNDGGVNYMIKNDTGFDQTFTNSEINLYNDQTISTNAQIVFDDKVNFRNSQQKLHVTGTGGVTFNDNVNINSTKFEFSNSGTNTVNTHFNSVQELKLNGGGTTVFNGNVTVNNTQTIIEDCDTVGIFNATFNSNSLLVKDGGTAIFSGGQNTKNFNNGFELRGGTIILESNQVINEHKMTLSGGHLDLNNHSQRLESLTLTANSTIDFGDAVGANTLKFNDVTPTWAWDDSSLLTILGFEQGVDKLEFKTLDSDSLEQIQFYGDYGQGEGFYTAQMEQSQSGDFFYVTPDQFLGAGSLNGRNNLGCCDNVMPVPEPGTYAAGGVIVLFCGGFFYWKRRKEKAA